MKNYDKDEFYAVFFAGYSAADHAPNSEEAFEIWWRGREKMLAMKGEATEET